MRAGVLALLMVVAGPTAHAQTCGPSANQLELDACASEAFAKADAELNAAYTQIIARLKSDAAATKLLVTAQKSWIDFRDSECAFATSQSVDGSIYPMLVAQCREALTRKRTGELNAYLNCQEGDLSCPVPHD